MLSQLRPCCIVVKGFTRTVFHTTFGSSLWHGSKGCLVLATDVTRPSLQKGCASATPSVQDRVLRNLVECSRV